MKQFLILFLPLLLIGCAFPDEKSEIREAELAAANFFESLAAGSYERAASLYAGSTEILASQNPRVPPEDEEALLQHACEVNGYRCMPILRVLDSEKFSMNEYVFTVEFVDGSGEIFILEPCCGSDPDGTDPTTRFFVYVIERAGDYFVTSLPPYVP